MKMIPRLAYLLGIIPTQKSGAKQSKFGRSGHAKTVSAANASLGKVPRVSRTHSVKRVKSI